MTTLKVAIQQLRRQRDDIQNQIDGLDNAIRLLGGRGGRGGRRHMSAAGRSRIAAAQKARWAKWKKAHKK